MQARLATRLEKLLAALAALVLVAGLLRSGAGLAYYYVIMLQTPFVLSPTATTDELVKSVGLPAADALVTGVAIAGWSSEEDVAVVAAVSAVSAQDAVQFHRVAGYLLYPRRIWLIRWCDPAASAAECAAESDRAVTSANPAINDIGEALLAHRARNLIVLGREALPLHSARTLTLSPVVHLVGL